MPDHPMTSAPRELSPEEAQERAEWAYAVHQKIVTNLRDGRAAAWRLAEALYEFDEEAGWSALGYDTLTEYLADPEIGMKRRTYYDAVAKWRSLHVRRGVQTSALLELDPSKVSIVLPTIDAAEAKLDDVLDDVKEMGARDLREKYLGRKELPPPTDIDDPDLADLNAEAVEDDDNEPDDEHQVNGNLPRTTDAGSSGQLPTLVGLCPSDHMAEFYVPDPDDGDLCPECDRELIAYVRLR